MTLDEIVGRSDLFEKATGTYETPGLGSQPSLVTKGEARDVGTYCSNNSTLAYVDESGDVYVGRATGAAIDALDRAGYRPGYFWVPHSNDAGMWMREHFEAPRQRKAEAARQAELVGKAKERIASLKPIQRLDDLFTRATGTYETPGLGSQQVLVGREDITQAGMYDSNNGTLAFVSADGSVYVGAATEEAFRALEQAGYTSGGLWVPHSNDAGMWMRANFYAPRGMRH